MNEKSIIHVKSYSFSIRIVKLYQYLIKEHKEYSLAKQILKSGTSIGANIEEATGGYSKREFLSKLSISYREARETHYWLRLLFDTNYINKVLFESLLKDCEEILRILSRIQLTTKSSMKKKIEILFVICNLKFVILKLK
jgi:four helix bundle protein